MEVNKVKEKKAELENKIKQLLNDFGKETGCFVESMSISEFGRIIGRETEIHRVNILIKL